MAKIKAKQLDFTGLTLTAFTPTRVQLGVPLTVPEFWQWILYSDVLYIDDTLNLNGDLVMLL